MALLSLEEHSTERQGKVHIVNGARRGTRRRDLCPVPTNSMIGDFGKET